MCVVDGKLVSTVPVISGDCSIHEFLTAAYVNSEACFLCDLLIICTQKSSTQSEVNAQVQVFLSYFGYLLEALFVFSWVLQLP